MARRTVTYLVDDLDGTEIGEGATATSFALNGVTYTIDLSPENAEKLEELLAPYIEKAKRTGGSPTPSRRRGGASANSAQFLASVREWANSSGYTVGERGRVKAEIIEAYRAAH
ncbi:MAG: Lsr2 family protein [Micrococcales bacterium]|nr:Lsr2 family protein [Micrococcales bacterium]